MLWNASAMNGYTIEASDGRLGTVSDFLFEDASWIVRWLVVNTGSWLSGRKVLLPLAALGQPDPARREFPVKLTTQQVKESPGIDTDRPVSRQMEAHLYDHYGWDPYWGGRYYPMGDCLTPSLIAPLNRWESKSRDEANAHAQPTEGDPHLRSVEAVTGYHIHAVDGEIGHVEDFLLSDVGWSIRYVVVDTRNWWPGKKVLISPRSVREIDWERRLMHLDVNRQKVKHSPPYDWSVTADRAYEAQLHGHYGIGWTGF
ncbi:hypothetical protein SAMN05519103_08773 [Rhizobiales bacterium GAS113]|nr:hypothetical protein SAMN05519103_08773 [Rhizobiales bacterium GAS113]